MSRIISVLPRHYIGTAAEIGGITGVCGDTAYSTDTHLYYHWCGATWVIGGIPYYVERLAEGPDKEIGDFTTNGVVQVNGLDLSGILPVGAFMPKLGVRIEDDAAGSWFTIYRDAVKDYNRVQLGINVANLPDTKVADVSIEADRCYDYIASNVVFTLIEVTVLGWWIRRCQ